MRVRNRKGHGPCSDVGASSQLWEMLSFGAPGELGRSPHQVLHKRPLRQQLQLNKAQKVV